MPAIEPPTGTRALAVTAAGAATLMLNQWIGIALVAVMIAAAAVIGHVGEKKRRTRAEAAAAVASNA